MRGSNAVRIAMVAALLTVASACARSGPATADPPSAPSTTSSAAATTTPAPPPLPQLGPDGFGALKIGMTKAEAAATGLTAELDAATPTACGGAGDGHLAGATNAEGADVSGMLVFSQNTGRLVAIYAYPGVKTPQGIGVGSTYDEVHAAYPAWRPIGPDPTSGRGGVVVPGNPDASYRIVVLEGRVTQLSLDSQQDCYE